MTHALTIGQLAKASGVASKTIRYYEQIGVLPAPRRSAARYSGLGDVRHRRGIQAEPSRLDERRGLDHRSYPMLTTGHRCHILLVS